MLKSIFLKNYNNAFINKLNPPFLLGPPLPRKPRDSFRATKYARMTV